MKRNANADFGFARARDQAFDAVMRLWERRKKEGFTQAKLAEAIGRDPAWVSRYLRGPGNWTLRTAGAFVAGLEGELEITAHPLEDPIYPITNYDAYIGYRPSEKDAPIVVVRSIGAADVRSIGAAEPPMSEPAPTSELPEFARQILKPSMVLA